MCKDDPEPSNEKYSDDHNIEFYTQAMEDIRDRRTIEWQTFAVVNVIYLGILKVLHDYDGMLSWFQAIVIIAPILLFTYIWFIRIYGNSRRCDYPTKMRNDILKALLKSELRPPNSNKIDGGLLWWYREWPLWSYRGICMAICLFCLVIVGEVLYKTGDKLFTVTNFKSNIDDGPVPDALRIRFIIEKVRLLDSAYGIGGKNGEIIDKPNVYTLKKKDDILEVYKRWIPGFLWFLRDVPKWSYLLILPMIFGGSVFADWIMLSIKKGKKLEFCSFIDLGKSCIHRDWRDLKCDIRKADPEFPKDAEIKTPERYKWGFRSWLITDQDKNQLYLVKKMKSKDSCYHHKARRLS